MSQVGEALGGNLTAPGPVVVRRGRAYPATIDYRCGRCSRKAPSQPMPEDLAFLPLYGLPDGWVLVVRPRGEDDESRCVECQEDIERGAPEELWRG